MLAALKERCGGALRAVALEGSTAKGLAAPRSDLEFRVILSGRVDRWHTLFMDGMFVGLSVSTWAQTLRDARTVDYEWPLKGDRFTACRVLHDPEGLYARLRGAAVRAEARADFTALVREALADMYEHVLKLMCLGDGALSLTAEAREVAFWAAIAAALANRHLYASSRRMFEDALTLPGMPAVFAPALQALLSSGDAAPAVRAAAGRLWPAMREWGEGLGLTWEDPALQSV